MLRLFEFSLSTQLKITSNNSRVKLKSDYLSVSFDRPSNQNYDNNKPVCKNLWCFAGRIYPYRISPGVLRTGVICGWMDKYRMGNGWVCEVDKRYRDVMLMWTSPTILFLDKMPIFTAYIMFCIGSLVTLERIIVESSLYFYQKKEKRQFAFRSWLLVNTHFWHALVSNGVIFCHWKSTPATEFIVYNSWRRPEYPLQVCSTHLSLEAR